MVARVARGLGQLVDRDLRRGDVGVAESEVDHIRACLADRQAGNPLVVQRFLAKKNIWRPFDISPFIEEAVLTDNNTIDVCCRVSQEGTVRVDELMRWFKLQPEDLREPVRRVEIYWN